MTDLPTLIDLCTAQAEQLAQAERSDMKRDGKRLEALVVWLKTLDELPLEHAAWPGRRGFDIFITHPGDGRFGDEGLAPQDNPAEPCMPTVESGPNYAHVYRARCLGCGERGPARASENEAAEDANDHAFPGWRDLPVVPAPPSVDNPKQQAVAMRKWRALVDRMLPAGWLEQGGPIRTMRQSRGTRHVPSRAPGGGYDMSAGVDPKSIVRAEQVTAGARQDTAVGENFSLF